MTIEYNKLTSKCTGLRVLKWFISILLVGKCCIIRRNMTNGDVKTLASLHLPTYASNCECGEKLIFDGTHRRLCLCIDRTRPVIYSYKATVVNNGLCLVSPFEHFDVIINRVFIRKAKLLNRYKPCLLCNTVSHREDARAFHQTNQTLLS